MRIQFFVCAVFAAVLAAACSGTTTQTIPGAPGNAFSNAGAGQSTAKLTIRLEIPRRHRRAHYVSASTKSMSIFEGNTKLGTFDTTAGSPKCKAVNGETICSFTLGVVAGKNETFAINAFDRKSGKGNLLSAGRVVKTIVPGLNVIPITLDGVVHSIAIAIVDANPPAGTPATTSVVVMANDADGNTIVGPGRYYSPIHLTNTDATGATTLSSPSVTSPNSSITLSYTGASLTRAVIQATADGVHFANSPVATFQPVPTAIAEYPLPLGVGSNGKALAPQAITKDATGNLWYTAVASTASPAPIHEIFEQPASQGPVISLVPGSAPSTNLPDDAFNGLTLGPDGNVWYAGSHDVGYIKSDGTVTNVPLSGVSGICAGFFAQRIVPASDGGLWVTVQCTSGSQLVHFTTGLTPVAKANALPAADGAFQGVVVGKDRDLYVAGIDTTSGKAALFQVAVTGDTVSGTPAIVDLQNPLDNPASLGTGPATGVAQTTDGDLWVTNYACNPSAFARVHLASSFTASTITVFPTYAGCSWPAFPIALSDGSLWIPENDYPEMLQVIPAPNEAAPFVLAVPMPSPDGVFGSTYDAVLGNDGYLYVTTLADQITPLQVSGSIIKVAY